MPANRLIHEKSPYLLQHAHNPVDWYPWGEEAFRKARQEDKPIFLSIGYSTCHWCHVMERESFEDEDTAAMLNTLFVPVKVDREERPDIDRIYMSYVQAATGGGGWPMSVWLTPELKPFVGGTYFPPDNRYGRAGFPLVLERIAEAWKSDRAKILAQSATVLEQIRDGQGGADEPGADRVESALMDRAFQQLRRSFDTRLGGFGSAPKFPRPSVYNFLLRYWKRTGDDEALDMVTATLIGMARGGMNDQLGGGFHRYSVDEYWFVPHFEKMLYDQAQLVVSYLEAFQITRDEEFANAARRTLDYVMRDMTSPEGGFWSAEDADSAPDPGRPKHKTEGAFYIWAWDEVVRLLGQEHAEWFSYRYGMERGGNVRNDPHHEFERKNILFEAKSVVQTAAQFGHSVEEMTVALQEAGRVVLEARAKRVRPHLDDKILTAWNGLMISAFAKGAAILEEPRYALTARRAADFLLGTMRQADGGLLRRYRAGEAGIRGMLDDYAFLAQGLLDLYESSFEERYLEAALAITQRMEEQFGDAEGGGYFASAEEDAAALVKLKDDYDGAEPSGNSVALMNLLRLEQITGSEQFRTAARRLIAAFQTRLGNAPHALPHMLAACELDNAVKREIVVAGDVQQEMARELWKNFDPFRTVQRASVLLASMRPEVATMTPTASGALVYVCQNFTCQAPVATAEALARLLN